MFKVAPVAMLQSTSVSQKGTLAHSRALTFTAAAQRMPLDCLALKARGACVPGLRTVIISVTKKELISLSGPPIFVISALLDCGGQGSLSLRVPQDCNQQSKRPQQEAMDPGVLFFCERSLSANDRDWPEGQGSN